MGCILGFFALLFQLLIAIFKFIIQVAIWAIIIYCCFSIVNFVFGIAIPINYEMSVTFATIISILIRIVGICK